MNRLEHADAARVHVGARGHAHAALERGAEVGDDVAEEVAGDDHLEGRRVLDQIEAERVDVDVLRLDLRVLLGDLEEAALPELVAVHDGVRLVGHVHGAVAVVLRVLEGGADDPLHPFARVDALLYRDLVRRALLEVAADARVDALGVLAEDDEVAVPRLAPRERHEAIAQTLHRPHVAVEVEAEAEAEEDVPRVAHVGDTRIAQGAEEDGVVVFADGGGDLVGEGRSVSQMTIGAQVVVGQLDVVASDLFEGLEELHPLRDHVLTDSVSWDDGDTLGRHGARDPNRQRRRRALKPAIRMKIDESGRFFGISR